MHLAGVAVVWVLLFVDGVDELIDDSSSIQNERQQQEASSSPDEQRVEEGPQPSLEDVRKHLNVAMVCFPLEPKPKEVLENYAWIKIVRWGFWANFWGWKSMSLNCLKPDDCRTCM